MLSLFVVVGLYLAACATALALHEGAHYAVHSLYAESATVGLNRYGPYVDAVYAQTAPTTAIRLGSIAPTLIYGPLVLLGWILYLGTFPMPQLDVVQWSLVLTPILILVVPTGADIQACVNV